MTGSCDLDNVQCKMVAVRNNSKHTQAVQLCMYLVCPVGLVVSKYHLF